MISHTKTTSTTRQLLAMLMVVSLIAAIFAGCTPTDDTEEALQDLRHENPEQFLQEALERSGFGTGSALADISDDLSVFDLSRFGGGPTEHNLSLRVDQVDPGFFQLPGRPQIDLNLLMDTTAGNFLMDFDIIDAGPFSFRDNRIFASPDILALSMPELYDSYRYITVDPNTFVDDWNASNISNLVGAFDPGTISAALSMFENVGELLDISAISGLESQIAQFGRLSEDLAATGQFRDGGDTEITLGTNTHNAAVLGYYASTQEISGFVNAVLGVATEIALVDSIIGIIAMVNPTADTGTFRQALQSFIASLSFNFPAGVYIYHYVDIDTGIVLRSRIPTVTVVMDSGNGSRELTVEVATYYLGEQNLTDVTNTTITLTDGSGNVIEADARLSAPEDGPYVMHMQVDMGRDGILTFEAGFDPSASANNFWLEVELEDRHMHVGFDLRGNAAGTPGEFALNNGQTTIILNGATALAASFEYSLRNISTGDVSIDHTQAIDLFDIGIIQLTQIFARFALTGLM